MGVYFDARFEQESIDQGIAAQQRVQGMAVQWWLWDPVDSRIDTLYDEDVSGASRRWKGPILLSVFSANRIEGPLEDTGNGAYTVDSVTLVLGYRQATDEGLVPPVDQTNSHLKDRFVWDGRVWNPSSIVARNLLGQGGTRATIIVHATQVRDDELVNDDQFQKYAEPDFAVPTPGHVV